jgi:hypothetical protein
VFCQIVIPHLTIVQACFAAAVTTAIALLWHIENGLISSRIFSLEEDLSKYSGGMLEDIYIKARYSQTGETATVFLHRFEPFIWPQASLLILASMIKYTGL